MGKKHYYDCSWRDDDDEVLLLWFFVADVSFIRGAIVQPGRSGNAVFAPNLNLSSSCVAQTEDPNHTMPRGKKGTEEG